MTVGEVIARIRAQCPAFATVTHAMTDAVDMALPAAIVSPPRIDADPSPFLGLHEQRWRRVFPVWILVRRAPDGSVGAGAADEWEALFQSLHAALVTWTPDPLRSEPLAFAGGGPDRYAGQVAAWRAEFAADAYVRHP